MLIFLMLIMHVDLYVNMDNQEIQLHLTLTKNKSLNNKKTNGVEFTIFSDFLLGSF